MTKILADEALACNLEELKENRAQWQEKDGKNITLGHAAHTTSGGKGAYAPIQPMHRVVIQRRIRRSSPPRSSPFLHLTHRALPEQLLSPIPLSPNRRSLGPTTARVPRNEKVAPPRPMVGCRTPPVRMSSQPSRHSLGSRPSQTPPVPGPVRRSSSQGRLGESPIRPRVLTKPRMVNQKCLSSHSPSKGEHKDEAGRTALMHAARRGDLDGVTALLQSNCWVDDVDSCKCTALMYAATYGHLQIARCLVHHNADVNAQSHDKWTPLIAACYNGHAAMVEFFLSNAADLESADERGWTALMHAAFTGHYDILKCLLQRGAQVDVKDKEGRTALVYAAFSGHLENVKVLLAHAHVQCHTELLDGKRDAISLGLMYAADKGHCEIVQTFLDAAVAPPQTIRWALEHAVSHGHQDVVHLLQSFSPES